jgi:hypothetical protein
MLNYSTVVLVHKCCNVTRKMCPLNALRRLITPNMFLPNEFKKIGGMSSTKIENEQRTYIIE